MEQQDAQDNTGKDGEDGTSKQHEHYTSDDPTATSAQKQEEMAREAVKKFKSLG